MKLSIFPFAFIGGAIVVSGYSSSVRDEPMEIYLPFVLSAFIICDSSFVFRVVVKSDGIGKSLIVGIVDRKNTGAGFRSGVESSLKFKEPFR